MQKYLPEKFSSLARNSKKNESTSLSYNFNDHVYFNLKPV